MNFRKYILIIIVLAIFSINMDEELNKKINNSSSFKFDINENGETYGTYLIDSNGESIEPDLIEAQGQDGIEGYVKKIDLYDEENQPNTPEEAVQYALKRRKEGSRLIPLYESDGETVIGVYKIG